MADQVIDRAMAASLHADACRTRPMVGWVVMWDTPEHPDRFIARLVAGAPTAYMLAAGTLAGIHEQLPPNLARSQRQPVDPPEVVEVWFPAAC